MRITNQMIANDAIQQMTSNLEALNRYQQQASTGKQFQNASDNPIAACASLSLNSSIQTIQGYMDTASHAGDWLDANDSALQQIEDAATQAINTVTTGLTDTENAGDRVNLATTIGTLTSQAVDLANSTQNGQYIFAGTKVNTKPFTLNADGSVTYNGDPNTMQRSLGPGQSVTINAPGGTTFQAFFDALSAAKTALTNNDTATLRTQLDGLQSALDTIDQFRAVLGISNQQVQQASDSLQIAQTGTQSLLTKKEDINMAEGLTMVQSQTNTYQAVLEVSQRAVSTLSLFDYLK
ncbi:MAG: flagellar hook-associated protein FlgL [Anaerolineaceae bacterium]|nr:flagellar hook-associated protein FlgL [Anaerolineaceae bacterium]